MIIDLVLSLQNGYENRGLITPYLYRYNFYDCCIKVGNDVVPQRISINNIFRELTIIPTMITKKIPCLIGVNSVIEIEQLKKEMNMLKPYFDLESLLFICSNTCIKFKGTNHFINDLDTSRIINIFDFMPNFIDYNKFLFNYSHPFFDCAGGFFDLDGNEFNMFKYNEFTQSSIALSNINPRYIGNVIGILNLFEMFKGFKKPNNEILYSFLSKNFNNGSQILIKDYMLSYSWLDLDKVNSAIKRIGVNVICCYGINLIKHLDSFSIIIGGKENIFEDNERSQNKIKNCLIDYFKLNSQITEILFF